MRGLHPLARGLRGRLAPDPARLAETRLREAWAFAVGPLLARRTYLLRFHRGRLVVGCWELSAIPSLRLAAEAAWPSLQERLSRAFKLHLSAIEIVPCDPPPPPEAEPQTPEDPFKVLLLQWRNRKA